MIVVHHLNNSRSQRILWLLEEVGSSAAECRSSVARAPHAGRLRRTSAR
jgi:hypothetical protein